MAEPPSKRFRFDAATSRPSSSSSSSTVRVAGSGANSSNNGNNNNNNLTIANMNANDDPWGDDIVFDEKFDREFQEICSQNISTVVDFNRRSSHPASQHPAPSMQPVHPQQQQQQQQQQRRPPLQPQGHQQALSNAASPTIRRSFSNQQATTGGVAAAPSQSVTAHIVAPRPTGLSSSSQYYNFQRQRPPVAAVATVAPATPTAHSHAGPGVARYPAASSASAMRKPSGSDALTDLRDRLHTVQGECVTLTEQLETAKRTLANERAAREKAESAVKKLETERAFSAKEVETLLSENQSLSIRLRKREEQQQQTQLQFSQLMNRDVIPPTQVFVQQQQQPQQFPSMASFCSRSPVSGPSPLGLRSPHTPLRPQHHHLPPPPQPPTASGSPSPSAASTDDMDYDEDEDAAVASLASASATPGGGSGWPSDHPDSDDSDSWPVVAKQPESAGWHRRRPELLALYPGLLAQCSNADRAIRCLTKPQQCQHQRQLAGDIIDDMPAATWSPDSRREFSDAMDCLAKLATRELELPTVGSAAGQTGSSGPGEAERLLAPIRGRLSGYLLALRLRGCGAETSARQIALALNSSGSGSCSGDDSLHSDSDLTDLTSSRRVQTPTPAQLANLGLDALQQLWRVCQLSGEAAMGLLRNVGRRETALVMDLFDLVRLLPDDQELSACDTESLHCCLQVLHYLLLRLPENRRHQVVEFFCTGLETQPRRRLVRSRYLPTVTLYVKILLVAHSGLHGYAHLAAHNDPCHLAELAQCLELQPDASPEPDLLHLIDALTCLIRECIALERKHRSLIELTLLNRDCRDKCFFKVICALSNALAQLMPQHYSCTASLDPGLVSSIHGYIRTMDALKDYLDVQSCKEMVRQDKTHYFIISAVECFKDLTVDNKYLEKEYLAPCRP